MVNSLDLTTLIAQIPNAQKLHNVQQVHPEMQQAAAQQLVLKKQQEKKKQIAKSDPTTPESETHVDENGHHDARQDRPHDTKRAKPESEDSGTDQGHLIDIQV